ncbi:MAG: prepilin peptidase [Nocardioides sp.]|uniref:prepilin peptidase n=1 Tax=Nocardioides sp. TaxID=35761 RepID=UPI003F023BED
MPTEWWVVLVGAVAGAVGGWLVPRLVASIPEPEVLAARAEAMQAERAASRATGAGQGSAPEDTEPAVEPVPDPVVDEVGADDEPPKPLYADLAAVPRLGAWCALLGAGAGALLGWSTGLDWPLLWLWGLIPVLVALAYVDLRTKLLPTVVVVPATLATLVVVVAVGLLTGATDSLLRAVIAMVGVRTFYRVLYALRSSGIGFGDVRLAALLGLVMGWAGWGAAVIGTILPFFLMALPSVALGAVAMVRRDSSFLKVSWPFGPFMVVAVVVALVWGNDVAAYIWG